jgi:hypothetical protein
MGVTSEGALLPIGTLSGSIATPVLGEGAVWACSLVITASCDPAGEGPATAMRGESESEERCYGRLAVVSDLDDGGFALNVDKELRGSAVLYRSKYNGAMLGSRWT